MIMTAVPTEGLDVVWKDAAKALGKSIQTMKGKFTLGSLYEALKREELVLWIIVDDGKVIAAITTKVLEYPSCKAMAMDWIGGERMGEWLEMAHEKLIQHSIENGCSHLEGYGRKGWGRWLQKYGWKPEYIAYRMELYNG
tara:strand:- start:480 stop:899 length:420 start_codon:yes stop_codon:yes gene_type:complete